MLVCYYHTDLHKVMVEHLGSVEILRFDAASLEKVLSDFFRDNNIPWHWQSGKFVSLDSCAVMRGSKTGLETRIQQYCPNLLDVDGDSCHHIHNAAKKFSEAFDGNLERLFSDLQVDHQWSPDQVNKMQAHLTLQYLYIDISGMQEDVCVIFWYYGDLCLDWFYDTCW